MTERSAFLDALAHLDRIHLTSPQTARKLFPDVLVLATPDERAFLDELADIFTRYPFETAHKRLDAMWKAQPERRVLINACAPDTDPGLHHRDLPEIFEVSYTAAELPPMPVRDRYRPLITQRVPSQAIDAARNDRDRIAARAQARPVPAPAIPGDHRSHLRPYALAVEAMVTSYANTALFTDATTVADSDTQPEPSAGRDRGDATARPVRPRPRTGLVRDHAEATELWDRAYVDHVANQYDDDTRAAWDDQRRHDAEHTDDGDESLAERTRDFFDTHDDTAAAPRTRRTHLQRQGVPRRRSRITEAERRAFAEARTGLRVRDDARPEIPEQGNGLDYDHAAMILAMGWRCVGCFIERAMSDQRPIHARGTQWVSDDGLCDSCRADGRPGVPPLPERFTAEQFVHSRCEFLAATYPATAHILITEVWHRAAPHPVCRHITKFLTQHPDLTPNPVKPLQRGSGAAPADTTGPRRRASVKSGRATLGADQRRSRCDGCTQYTVINTDGYCLTCRIDLGLVAARRRPQAA
ncbi:hypothetical protein AB0B25_07745 [Nocardia sp. NPDC049190]|uniref:hypothetical protein n=1 Tax=Nocardia sp. NPDC049190 TaxID=3155650 RepID=UPI00340C768A